MHTPGGHRSHGQSPLTPAEREEYETDLISFCDRELALLGDIWGLDVLYAGGSAPLWVEGLSRRIGPEGSLTAVDLDDELVEDHKEMLKGAGLEAPVSLMVGDVFEFPFEEDAFDLAYSAGLFHELEVREKPVERALESLARVVKNGGRIATSDFVDSVPAAQVEEEDIQKELMDEAYGGHLYGIGPPERLVVLHEKFLGDVRWSVLAAYQVRHLGELFLVGDELPSYKLLEGRTPERLRERRRILMERVRREGYTRPATLYVEGIVSKG